MKQKKKIKQYCEECDWNKKVRVAKYICNACGFLVCAKCEKESMGECPNCEPPYFVKL